MSFRFIESNKSESMAQVLYTFRQIYLSEFCVIIHSIAQLNDLMFMALSIFIFHMLEPKYELGVWGENPQVHFNAQMKIPSYRVLLSSIFSHCLSLSKLNHLSIVIYFHVAYFVKIRFGILWSLELFVSPFLFTLLTFGC